MGADGGSGTGIATLAVDQEVEHRDTWTRRETRRLARDHPRVHRVVKAIWGCPTGLLLPVAFVLLGAQATIFTAGDTSWFRNAGRGMLGPGFWDVFSDPGLQIGPVYLVGIGILTKVTEALRLPSVFLIGGLQAVLVTWLALFTTRHVARMTAVPSLAGQWVVGLTLVVGGLLSESIGAGHPEEIGIGLLLALAACSAADGRRARVGILLGLACGLKLWGVLGAPVALIGRRPRDVVVRAAIAVGMAAAFYLPFAMWGEVKTFSFTWGMSDRNSALTLLGGWLGSSDWLLRIVQATLSVAVGCAVALRRAVTPLSVVICTIAARLLLDPLRLFYYPGPLIVLVLIWAWTRPADHATRWRWVAACCVPVLVIAPSLIPTTAVDLVTTGLLVAVPAAVLWAERSGSAGTRQQAVIA